MSEPEPARCEVCGDELDFYGCLGEFRGKHTAIEMAKLRARIAELEAALAEQKTHASRDGRCHECGERPAPHWSMAVVYKCDRCT